MCEVGGFGIGADIGFLRPALWKRLDFGLKLQDITTTYLSWSTGRNELITPAVVPLREAMIGIDSTSVPPPSMSVRSWVRIHPQSRPVIVGERFYGQGIVTIFHDETLIDNPPPGFEGNSSMYIADGSWERIVE